jgi:hypothetical protein
MDRKHKIGARTVLVLVIALAALTAGAASADVRQDPAAPQPEARAAQTITVDNPADSGTGTLRQAILDASPGDTITFDTSVFPPTSPVTIALTSALPPLEQGNVTIDASDAGVILDGSALSGGAGLRLESSGNVIKGLEIYHFPNIGIRLEPGADQNVIGGDNTVGAGPTGEGNVLSENGVDGLWIEGDDNVVQGNFIGTDAAGKTDRGNHTEGVRINGGAGNVIGGTAEGEQNVISGNGNNGVLIHSGAHHNTVQSNLIGTDASGTSAVGNGHDGVFLRDGACWNVIGGDRRSEGNVLSGNGNIGIELDLGFTSF